MRVVELLGLPKRPGSQLGSLSPLHREPPQNAHFQHRLRKLDYPVSGF